MTVNDLTNMMWYVQDIIVLESEPKSVLNYTANVERMKDKAVFVGSNAELRSDLYKDLFKCRYVQSFGSIDDYIVITLKK